MAERFLLKFPDGSSLAISAAVAQQSSTIRDIRTDFGEEEMNLPTNIIFGRDNVVNFFDLYLELIITRETVPLSSSVTLEDLLISAEVADFFGYDQVYDSSHDRMVNLVEQLVSRFTQALISHSTELLRSPAALNNLRFIYSQISGTVQTLIDEQLRLNPLPVYLGQKLFLTAEEQQYHIRVSEAKKKVIMTIVTDQLQTDGLPAIAGFIENPPESTATLYSEIANSPASFTLTTVSDRDIIADDTFYHLNLAVFRYVWLTFTSIETVNQLNANEYIKAQIVPGSVAIPPLLNEGNINIRTPQKQINFNPKNTVPRAEEMAILKYGPYLVTKESTLDFPTVRLQDLASPWQLVDEDDELYYQSYEMQKILRLLNLNLGRVIAELSYQRFDCYQMDDQGHYILMVRQSVGWVELYDIALGMGSRLFKYKLGQAIISHNTVCELDIHNQLIRLFFRQPDQSLIYLVLDLAGQVKYQATNWTNYFPGHSVRGSNLVLINELALNDYAPIPDTSFFRALARLPKPSDHYNYGLFSRHPITLELEHNLLMGTTGSINVEVRQRLGDVPLIIDKNFDQIMISPDGNNFIFNLNGDISYFRMRPGSEAELIQIKQILDRSVVA